MLGKAQLCQVVGAGGQAAELIVQKGLGPGQAEEEEIEEVPQAGKVIVDQIAGDHAAPEFRLADLPVGVDVFPPIRHQIVDALGGVLDQHRQSPALLVGLLVEQHQMDRPQLLQLPGQGQVIQPAQLKAHQLVGEGQPGGGVYLQSGDCSPRLLIGEAEGRLVEHIPPAQQRAAALLHGEAALGPLVVIIVVLGVVEVHLVGPAAVAAVNAVEQGDQGFDGLLWGAVYQIVRQSAHAEGELGGLVGLTVVIALPVGQQPVPGVGVVPEAQQGAGSGLGVGDEAGLAPEQDQVVVDHQAGDLFHLEPLEQLRQQGGGDGLPLKVLAGHGGVLHMQVLAQAGVQLVRTGGGGEYLFENLRGDMPGILQGAHPIPAELPQQPKAIRRPPED